MQNCVNRLTGKVSVKVYPASTVVQYFFCRSVFSAIYIYKGAQNKPIII